MNRATLLAAAALVVAASASAATRTAQPLTGPVHLSEARGPLRTADLAAFRGRSSSEVLAGPTSGLDSAFVIYTRLAPRAARQASLTYKADHTYLVLKGTGRVEVGDETFTVRPETLVLLPAGTPHRIWNESAGQVDVLEVIAPAPSRDLASLVSAAIPRRVTGAASLVRQAPPLGELAGGTGHASLNERILASRATGSQFVLERLNDMLPGGGRTETHLHPFDQVYFVRKGEMAVQYGMRSYTARDNTLVLLPVGVAHNNLNNGNSVQSVVTLLLPEPVRGNPMGQGVTFAPNPPAGAGRGAQAQ